MTEPLKRRSLLQDVEVPIARPTDAAIAATAERNGFSSLPSSEANRADNLSQSGMRRRRQPTGRVHQFNVRLRADTLEAIYEEANDRNIPVAQVIEEAMSFLRSTRTQQP